MSSTAVFGWNAARDLNTPDAASNDDPTGIWSNGTTMWVADFTDGKIYAYKMSDKSRDAGKDFDRSGLQIMIRDNDPRLSREETLDTPYGTWSDGTTMWTVDPFDRKIYAYDMSTKARDAGKDFDTLTAANNDGPRGIWSDGTTMWVADSGNDKIYAYRMSDKSRDAGKDFDTLKSAGNTTPSGIWSDGSIMWVADSLDRRIYAYRMTNKSRHSSKDFITLDAAGNDDPTGIWSDGSIMWVADGLTPSSTPITCRPTWRQRWRTRYPTRT